MRATGRGYVLPNRGQQGIPLVSVNTDTIKVEVYRIGDRSLAQTLQGGDFAKQISSYDIAALKERTGARVYAGEMAVATRLNEDVTTAFPIAEAIPKLQPGVYVLAAFASTKKEDEGYRQAATQWFIVSDLGLTAINGDDGMHTFVRSLAAATPVINANVRLIARNNEVLGTVKTDSRGYARFDAGLKRGEGGLAPAVLVADTPDGDYAFLDLATAAFDLTDRGVKGRVAPGPIDAFAYTDRGVYRPGEQVHLAALARDSTGKASAVPVTVIFSRPDGVEHARVTLADQGQGGRATTLKLAGSAMTGTWRAKVHTDPKANPIAQASFLVEDFVPGAPGAQAGARHAGALPAGARHHQARGTLPLWAARRRPRRRRRDRGQALHQGCAGLCRLQVRPRRRAGGPRAQAARRPARHRRRGQGRHRRAAARACPRPTGRSRPT